MGNTRFVTGVGFLSVLSGLKGTYARLTFTPRRGRHLWAPASRCALDDMGQLNNTTSFPQWPGALTYADHRNFGLEI